MALFRSPDSFPGRAAAGSRSGAPVPRRVVVAGVASASALFLASCAGKGDDASPRASTPAASPSTSGTAAALKATVTPADGSTEVNPVDGVTVTASQGRLTAVTVKNAAGKAVKGALAADGSSWKSAERLAFDEQYTVAYAGASESEGATSTFSTTTPPNQMDAFAYPPKGSTVGIAQPVQITFSEPVTNKKDVEKAITITSSSGQKGRFYWLSDKVVRYRPEAFWAPNSTITVDFKMFGVDVGGGMIGNFDATHAFQTHNDRHAVVSDKDLMLRVYIDGKHVRTFPTTLGNERWPSADGIFPIMEQARKTMFRAESIGLKPGDQDYYEPFEYEYTSRLTSTGVFVHKVLDSALPALGRDRISHGCVSLAEDGAKFIYENFTIGDYIEVRDTGNGTASMDKGFMDWNVPWKEYGV